MKRFAALLLTAVITLGSVSAISAEEKLLAFPGAEGGGRFTSGGRGCEVYVVDTLEDYSSDEEPIKGSFRDAVSQSNRTVVFNVSGVIRLKERLLITNKENLTIAGQTAPADGITVYGFETNISNSQNVIIRYMRFRPGAENVLKGDSMDAIWGRSMKNVMIDHLSTSWSTDETMSLYRAENMTVQWSIIAESLAMSGHTKGRHGYGAIWGGVNTTYHHNLIANHTSRNPRFGGGTPEADDNDHIAEFDVRNNVLYNWGFNTAYGGGRARLNFINNYLKAGQGTREKVMKQVLDCGEKNKPSWFYIDGNFITTDEEISEDNSKGIYISDEAAPFTVIVDEPFQMDANSQEAIETQSAQDAYKEVLMKAGAVYPKRDALDSRIVFDVKNDTGIFANNDSQVGGLPYRDEIHRADDFDTDNDGMADEWERANGLNPNDPSDNNKIAENGYTNIENYMNSLVDMDYEAENPEVSIASPSTNEIFETGTDIPIKIDASDDVESVELYNGEQIIARLDKKPFEYTLTGLEDGTYYISAKAEDKDGLSTQSDASVIHINDKTDNIQWLSKDIGDVKIAGNTSVYGSSITVKGNGKIGGIANSDAPKKDSFHFAYQMLIGDGEITAKLDKNTVIDNHTFSGLMIRENLGDTSRAAAIGLSPTKAYEWKETDSQTGKTVTYYRNPFSVYVCGRTKKDGEFSLIDENIDSLEGAQQTGVQLKNDIPYKDGLEFNGYYMKLKREGDIFTGYCSADGESWEQVGSLEIKMNEKVYMGLAVDSNKVSNNIENLNTAYFSNVEFIGSHTSK